MTLWSRIPSIRAAASFAAGLGLILASAATSGAAPRKLAPASSPADNPMKGLVPYAGMHPERFPHSLEFGYLALSEVMRGPDDFDWQAIEQKLNDTASRGCQAILRLWLEYPGKPSGVPDFLRREGVRLTEWMDGGTKNLTPDYADERLILAVEKFVAKFGQRYDGDPRLGYLTAGVLGAWGEWHTWPREELFAPKSTQDRVLRAYESAFKKTHVLLRYPAGEHHPVLVENAQRPFGYHDDSFAWGTLATNHPKDSWFYIPSLTAAGAQEKWRTQPIGGEIRPELWGLIFDEQPAHPKAQNFMDCVRQTHVTWLMDSGLFRQQAATERIRRAEAAVQVMGYDFYASEVEIFADAVSIVISNQGVAPFYADWAMELGTLSADGDVSRCRPVEGRLGDILPGGSKKFRAVLPSRAAGQKLLLHVINPLPNGKGKPLRFANADQDSDLLGWLTLDPP